MTFSQSRKLKPVHELIGREDAKKKMLKVFNEVGSGCGKVLFIPGHSGIGKTSLVQWLATPVTSQNGRFVTGKFNQYHQNIPFYAIRQALRKLWKQIQPAGDEKEDLFSSKIKDAIGDLGYLLTELVPEIKCVFDEKNQVEDGTINYIEARYRFITVIRKFLKAICLPEHPVVIFIDDWQWADSASIELLKGLHSESQLRYLLVVASYRNEEVTEGHILNAAIAELKRKQIPVEVYEIKKLNDIAVRELIGCALDAPLDREEQFTSTIIEYTHGNPFHIQVFLNFLFEEGFLWFEYTDHLWRWQLKNDIPEDIVALFVRKLTHFNVKTQKLISLAACIGSLFDIETLSIISNHSIHDCRLLLTPLETDGLITKTTDESIYQDQGCRLSCNVYEFLHDRVQQAAYSLIDPKKLPGHHLKIGRLLLSSLDTEALSDRLFEILEHLNSGESLIEDASEQRQMVDLNMKASLKAKAATAFNAMLSFNRAAFLFASKGPLGISGFWDTDYNLSIVLHRDLAESEFLEGDRTRAEQIIQDSLPYTRTAIERAETRNILIVQYTLMARYSDAISSGRLALSEFGIFLPEEDFETYRDLELEEVRKKLTGKSVDTLFDMPVMTDPEMLTATKLLITLGPPCYRTHQRLWSVIVPKVVNITLDFGLVPQVGYSFTAFGGLLCWVEGNYQTAKAFGEVSEKIMKEKFESPSDQSVFYLMVGSSTRHWFNYLEHARNDYLRAYEIGRQSGNLQYAAYAFGHNMYCRFFQGASLSELISETMQSLVFSRTRFNQWAIDLHEGGLNIFNALSNGEVVPDDPSLNDNAYLAQVKANKNIQVLCIYKILKSFYYICLGHNELALSVSDKTAPILYTVGTQGLLPWPSYVFIRLIILSGLYENADPKTRKKWYAELLEIEEQLKVWHQYCPENYLHQMLLASAEIRRIENKPEEAILLYDRAITEAQKHHFIHWEAIANERAYYFWAGLKNGYLAQIYWQQAYICYRTWGASAKLSLMESQFRDNLFVWFDEGIKRTSSGHPHSNSHGEPFYEKHIHLVRARSEVNMELQKRRSESKIADELANAVNRLRIESAERKLAEEELRKAMLENKKYIAQLEQKNAELDEFTYIASHDLQEPLRKLGAFSKLLITDVGENLSENAQKDIQYITDAASRMEILIQDLLTFSRTGRIEFPLENVSLNACVDEVEELLKMKLEEKNAVLKKTALPAVMGDKILLTLVFQNLIQNALKFNDKKTPVIEVTCSNHQETGTIIGIRDNGIGIKAQYAKQIFQPFKRLHGRYDYPGTGIGLAICKKVIERHNGSIWVESEPEEYSHFKFTINIKKDVSNER